MKLLCKIGHESQISGQQINVWSGPSEYFNRGFYYSTSYLHGSHVGAACYASIFKISISMARTQLLYNSMHSTIHAQTHTYIYAAKDKGSVKA